MDKRRKTPQMLNYNYYLAQWCKMIEEKEKMNQSALFSPKYSTKEVWNLHLQKQIKQICHGETTMYSFLSTRTNCAQWFLQPKQRCCMLLKNNTERSKQTTHSCVIIVWIKTQPMKSHAGFSQTGNEALQRCARAPPQKKKPKTSAPVELQPCIILLPLCPVRDV